MNYDNKNRIIEIIGVFFGCSVIGMFAGLVVNLCLLAFCLLFLGSIDSIFDTHIFSYFKETLSMKIFGSINATKHVIWWHLWRV